MYKWGRPGPPFRTTRGRVPDLRSPKIVYDVWNFSEPTRNVTELEVMVVGFSCLYVYAVSDQLGAVGGRDVLKSV